MFIKKNEWPFQPPDLNSMDYSVWESLTKKVCAWNAEKYTEQELKDKINKSRITYQLLKFVSPYIFLEKKTLIG